MKARDANRLRLAAILQSTSKAGPMTDTVLNRHIARIVANAETGTLSDADSRVLGAFAISTMRDCV